MRALPSVAVISLVLAGCASDSTAPPAELEPHLELVYVSGGNQEAIPGVPLGEPLVVQVLDRGHEVSGVRVHWSVYGSLGRFNDPNPAVTDARGLAFASFTPSQEWNVVQAAIIKDRPGQSVLFYSHPRPLDALAIYDRVSPSDQCTAPNCESIIFYPDHVFGVRYPTIEFRGRYSHNGPSISFAFYEPAWLATAAFWGDSLKVEYNFLAGMGGFEDGTFHLKTGAVP